MEQAFNKIFNVDCLDGIRQLADESIDCVITSPPYDKIRDYEDYNYLTVGQFEKLAAELYRVLKVGGVVVWVEGDSVYDGDESGTSFYHALSFKQKGFKLADTMIYIKNGGINAGSNKMYQQKFEYMFVFSKGKMKTHNLIKDRPNKYVENRIKRKKQKDGTYKEQRFKSNKFGVRYNYWIYDTGAGKSTKDKIAFNHPAIFPEQLAKDHIISWTNENDIVLDPFMGSGTTAVACKQLNRIYIGFEISKEYCEIANKRLEDIVAQENLFNEV